MSTAEHAYDPTDPHGFHADEEHHGHVIVPWQTLLGVLVVLLFFTVLTIFQSRAEIFASQVWGWSFPGWLNIVLAMSIATIKGALVVLFFMQLRYDKGVNGVLFLFTLSAVWLFLMFTMIDLSGRNTIVPWRGGEIVAGGSGEGLKEGRSPSAVVGGTGALYERVKQNYIAEHGQAAYDSHLHDSHHGPVATNSKDHSRVATGLTPGLFDSGPWADIETHETEHDAGH